jgi:translation initiation factor IF-3
MAKEKEIKKHQTLGGHKTVKMNYNTSDHDLMTKANQVAKFFAKGYKVNIQIFLRGRENAFQNLAHIQEKKEKEIKELEGKIAEEDTKIQTGRT